jgi:putative membrane protein
LPAYLVTLPAFLIWFPTSTVLLALFGAIYLSITPWAELALIRAGNTAAAASFSGALLGYALVLASVLAHAVSLGDLLTWGGIGLLVQVLAFLVGRLLLGADLPRRMREGQVSSGLFLGVVSLSAGVLNAATLIH